MISYGKILTVITIIALVIAVFFVFGAHELENHFCPINVSTGICGFLGNLTQIINHIFSMNIFLVMALPVFIYFLTVLFLCFYGYFLIETVPVNLYNLRLSFITPKFKVSESRWLRRHINSPTL